MEKKHSLMTNEKRKEIEKLAVLHQEGVKRLKAENQMSQESLNVRISFCLTLFIVGPALLQVRWINIEMQDFGWHQRGEN